ncbi:hypothetical protein [Arthrobacter sp. GMC3]|uniref:hypothetical protein n=1 Tax=Arthrobacter sp. GMC3 TaxID=2058894 RepID=UPI000CE39E52|nr:hypothetical protein [Arthrobacter sp. GMC3]
MTTAVSQSVEAEIRAIFKSNTASYEGINPRTALDIIRSVVENAILNQPRSLQKRIGPSEIGTPCDHCLAAKLAGWQQIEKDVPWLPFVGTSVHSQIEDIFVQESLKQCATDPTGGVQYAAENKTMVGVIDGVEIWGSTDLVDFVSGMTVDWKVVGATTLRAAKVGPSQVYRVQQHLYAKGWNDAGYRIDHVAIAYLPRNDISLTKAVWWTEPFNREIAEEALARANRFAANIRALRTINEEAVTAWITGLPRHNRQWNPDIAAGKECFDCKRFPDNPVMADPFLAGLDQIK